MSICSDRMTKVAGIVSDLKARFFPTPTYRQFQHEFDLLVAEHRANLAAGRQKEAHGLLVLAPSGAGKTTLVRNALHQHPSGLRMLTGEEERADVVSMAVPSPATPKGVGLSMLRPLALPHMDRLFLRENLDCFLASVFASAGLVDEVPAGAFPLRTIAQKATWPYSDLLLAVINGRLAKTWRLRGLGGLAALHLDLAEVRDIFEAVPLRGMSRNDLRKRLHINCSTVSLLLGKGVIASAEARHPRTRQPMSLITSEEVERFLDRYLPLGLMAYEWGTLRRAAASIIAI